MCYYSLKDLNIKFVDFISKISAKKRGKKKFDNIGSFGSISDIPKNVRNPKIVACTDGVGTKIEIANMIHKYNTIGIDLVAMSVNDLIVQGAKPLLFLDYISINDTIYMMIFFRSFIIWSILFCYTFDNLINMI